MVIVNLPLNSSFENWRAEAKQLLRRDVHPEQVEWYSKNSEPDLFSESPSDACAVAKTLNTAPIMVPPSFIQQSKIAICHRSADKFALLYRILWRLSHHEPHILEIAMDADVKKFGLYGKAVRRDLHKMTAFVRFDCLEVSSDATLKAAASDRALASGVPTTGPIYYAWFEPEHNILSLAGDFFMKRFSNTRWTVSTPIGSIHWDTENLRIEYGEVHRKLDVQDGIVELWDTYYASIFNPGRLKMKAMHAEMPRKYWHNMPETKLISALASDAPKRTQSMLAAEPSNPPRWAKKAVVRQGLANGQSTGE